jgi:phage tail sheath protein FI
MLEYVDRPLDRENADDIIGTINAYMRQLVGLGAIFGGRAWLDEGLTPRNHGVGCPVHQL